MACIRVPVTVACLRLSPLRRLPLNRIRFPEPSGPRRSRLLLAAPISRVGWDDVSRVADDFPEDEDEEPSGLQGYFDRVRDSNRGSELQSEFIPFVIEDQIVGHVHQRFIDHLRKFQEIFTFKLGSNGCYAGDHITLHSSLETPEDRTRAVGDAITCLGELIPAIPCDVIIWDAYILLS